MPKPRKSRQPAATSTPPQTRHVHFSEAASPTYQGDTVKIDPVAGIMEDARILGRVSQNNREYLESTLETARPLYEGVSVFIDHRLTADDSPATPHADRPYKSLFGWLEQIKVADGYRARFRFNPKHEMAESFCWWAQNRPQQIGFSHDAEGDGYDDPTGKLVVTSIDKVHSVDIVTRPATTRGLFESQGYQMQPTDPAAQMGLMENPDAAQQPGGQPQEDKDALASIMAAVAVLLKSTDGKDRDMAGKLLEILQAQAAPAPAAASTIPDVASPEPLTEEGGEDKPAKSKEDDDKDYYESLRKHPTGKRLLEELDGYKVRDALLAKRARVFDLCKAASLPKEAITDTFLESLIETPDEAKIQRLIEDRRGIYSRPFTQEPVSHGATGAPEVTFAEFEAEVIGAR